MISESVRTCSRARALWDKRVKGMHYSFWLCEKKITYSIHFIIQMLMKVYLYCLFPPIDWFTCSLDAEFIDVISCFVFAKREMGDCFCDSFEIIPQWRCEDMYIQKSQHISPQFDQLSFSIQYFFVCWAFLRCWSRSFLRQDYLIGIVTGRRRGEKESTFHTQTQSVPSRKRSEPRGSETSA